MRNKSIFRSRLALMAGGAIVAGVVSVSAYAGMSDPTSINSRLDALTLQSNQLGQQLFEMQSGLGHGAQITPPQPIKMAHSSQTGAINVRLDQIENQMRVLNGQVEGLQFQITQMQTLLERMQEDYEFRFQDLEGGSLGKTSAAPQPDSATPSERLPQAQVDNAQTSDDTLQSSVNTLGTLSVDQTGQPLDLNFNPGTSLSEADGDAQYEAGYEAIVRGDYLFAQDQFSQFVALYPSHPNAADAHHWLGEALMQNGEAEEAAEVFLEGYERFPTAARAPDMVLKLGIVLAKNGERETACRTFVEVLRKFPELPKSFKTRVQKEQRQSQC